MTDADRAVESADGHWVARVRCGQTQRVRLRIVTRDRENAEKQAVRLRELARRMVKRGVPPAEVRSVLVSVANAPAAELKRLTAEHRARASSKRTVATSWKALEARVDALELAVSELATRLGGDWRAP